MFPCLIDLGFRSKVQQQSIFNYFPQPASTNTTTVEHQDCCIKVTIQRHRNKLIWNWLFTNLIQYCNCCKHHTLLQHSFHGYGYLYIYGYSPWIWFSHDFNYCAALIQEEFVIIGKSGTTINCS